MKKMQIFEPAMCCPTGLCGVGVDPELLRISTVLNTLDKIGIHVERFNLSSSPQEFVTNNVVNTLIKDKGVDILPLIVVEDKVEITGRYPTNEEFVKFLNVPVGSLGEQPKAVKATMKKSKGCNCSNGNCN